MIKHDMIKHYMIKHHIYDIQYIFLHLRIYEQFFITK